MRKWVPLMLILLIGCAAPAAFAMPDLVVEHIELHPEAPMVGDLVLIEATIHNAGDGAAHDPFFVRFSLDGQEIALRSLTSGLRRGESQSLSVEWMATPGLHEVTVDVDTDVSRVEESDESNNVGSRIIHVQLDPEAEAMLENVKVVVATFDNRAPHSGFLYVGEGLSDLLAERLTDMGIRTLARFELDTVMQENGLNPADPSDLATAGRILGADILIDGAVTQIEVRESSLQLGFLSISGAEVDVHLEAQLINVRTGSPLSFLPASGSAEGSTGFSVDLSGFLAMLQSDSPDLCGGGLQTARAWYNIGESVPIGYRNAGTPGWFSIEITTGMGAFVKWLGWRYIDTDDCGLWYWNQLNSSGMQLNPGVYSAKVWNGTAYIAEVGFQIRPGLSLSTPPVSELTVGSPQFRDTVVGSAVNHAIDDLSTSLLHALIDGVPIVMSKQPFEGTMGSVWEHREGQIAAILPDGRIAINIGASDGVVLGEVFEILEVANVIVDPVTLEIINYDVLSRRGEMAITEVRDRVAFGEPLGDLNPSVGDLVRWIRP